MWLGRVTLLKYGDEMGPILVTKGMRTMTILQRQFALSVNVASFQIDYPTDLQPSICIIRSEITISHSLAASKESFVFVSCE